MFQCAGGGKNQGSRQDIQKQYVPEEKTSIPRWGIERTQFLASRVLECRSRAFPPCSKGKKMRWVGCTAPLEKKGTGEKILAGAHRETIAFARFWQSFEKQRRLARPGITRFGS